MCTAISFHSKDHYFGRTLDLEHSYQEMVTVTPRNFPLYFRAAAPLLSHHGFIGMATLANDYPLYYDGTNEFGLSIAALHFPGNAVYYEEKADCANLAHFELIPWVLGSFKTVQEVISEINKLNITKTQFSDEYPVSTLHWMVSDREQSIVIESTMDGLNYYPNPYGTMTNNPTFPCHVDNLRNYLHLSNREVSNTLYGLHSDSGGTGLMGLPGDPTSRSRFLRAFFTKEFSVCKDSESASVSQFFHILCSVSQTQGCVRDGNEYVRTIYTSCCNTDKCIYYYTTYENNQITGIRLKGHDLDGKQLKTYPLIKTQQFRMEN